MNNGGCKNIIIIALGVAAGIVLAVIVLAFLTDPNAWTEFWQGYCGSARGAWPCPYVLPTPTPAY
jgi:hypothetical protein